MIFVILGIIAYATSWWSTKNIIEATKKRKLVSKDVYKSKKPLRSRFGGLSFISAVIVTSFSAYLLCWLVRDVHMLELTNLIITSTYVIILAGLAGVLSDIFRFDWKVNFVIPTISALPLVFMSDPYQTGLDYVYVPGIGNIHLGFWYFILLLIGATGAPNAVNMIAGVNGIEAGMTSIILTSLGIIAAMQGKISIAIISFTLVAALLGFLHWNRYPAKIFPEDVGTWSFGAAIFAIAVLGKLEFWATLLMALYFVNLFVFLTKIKYEKMEKFGHIRKDGRLTSKYGSSLTKWLMKRLHPTEPQLVGLLLGLQTLVSALVVGLSTYFG